MRIGTMNRIAAFTPLQRSNAMLPLTLKRRERCGPQDRLPRKWEGEAPAEPWNSAKMGFDRSLTLPHETRNAVESMFSSEAVSFFDGGFMGRENVRRDDTNRAHEHFSWWGDTLWSRDLSQSQRKIRALQSIAPPRFMGRLDLQRLHAHWDHEPGNWSTRLKS